MTGNVIIKKGRAMTQRNSTLICCSRAAFRCLVHTLQKRTHTRLRVGFLSHRIQNVASRPRAWLWWQISFFVLGLHACIAQFIQHRMGIGHSKVKNSARRNRHIIVEDNGARDTVVKSQIIVPFLLQFNSICKDTHAFTANNAGLLLRLMNSNLESCLDGPNKAKVQKSQHINPIKSTLFLQHI